MLLCVQKCIYARGSHHLTSITINNPSILFCVINRNTSSYKLLMEMAHLSIPTGNLKVADTTPLSPNDLLTMETGLPGGKQCGSGLKAIISGLQLKLKLANMKMYLGIESRVRRRVRRNRWSMGQQTRIWEGRNRRDRS